jgi:hypothetical protein
MKLLSKPLTVREFLRGGLSDSMPITEFNKKRETALVMIWAGE